MSAQHFRIQSKLPVAAREAFAWHARPGAFERLVPPWERIRVLDRSGGVEDGATTTIELRRGPLRRRWIARHHDVQPGVSFSDTMEQGPFAAWTHVHRFTDADATGCSLEDDITYRLPFGRAGGAANPLARRSLARTFAFRHRRLIHDLERHSMTDHSLRVAITGASGLVGSALSAFLTTGGHRVTAVSRTARAPGEVVFAPQSGAGDLSALDGFDAVIHLAGAPIAKRWTEARKREIEQSRNQGTRALSETLARLPRPPRVLVSASAVGYYGNRADDLLTEVSEPGDDFLARVCQQWESATRPAADAGIRVVNARFGVVLEALLPRMLTPFRLGLGGPVGSGRQWVSWVALDDLVAAVLFALTHDELAGPVNVVAPDAVTNRHLARTLGRVLRRPALAPLPAAAARLLFGELADALLLAGQRVAPVALTEAGFRFAYPTLEDAVRHVLGR